MAGSPPSIGLKYCGGCNPRYDRAEIAARLKQDFPDSEILTGDAAAGAEVVAVINGCPSRCAAGAVQGKKGTVVLAFPEDYPRLAELVKSL